MTRFQCLTTLTCAVGITSSLFAEDAAKKYAGKINSASESQVVVMVGTELLTFVLTKDTTITLNGKAAKAAELKPEDGIEVHAERDEDKSLRATSLKVTRKASAQQPASPVEGTFQ